MLCLPNCGWGSSPPCSRRPQRFQVPLHPSCQRWPRSCRKESWFEGYVTVDECEWFLMCTPVIWTNRVCHRSVIIISYQPVETLVGEEADLLPLRTRHIVTACVQITQQQDVLLDKCNGWVCPILRTCCMSSMNCDLFVWHVKKRSSHWYSSGDGHQLPHRREHLFPSQRCLERCAGESRQSSPWLENKLWRRIK